jgi:hypothetical protein
VDQKVIGSAQHPVESPVSGTIETHPEISRWVFHFKWNADDTDDADLPTGRQDFTDHLL